MWIDSHCHLNHTGIADKGLPKTLIQSARDAGVGGMITICCRLSEEVDSLIEITNSNENVWCSIGTHPHDAGLEAEKKFSADDIAGIVRANSNVVAIGETGLDYYYDNSPRDDQAASFRKHLHACVDSNVPVIVHTRDAEEDTARILKEEGEGTSLSGVMHCFSSSRKLAEEALEMGFYISFSGIITFKKADELREIAKMVPLDKLLVETDAPFLAPVPYRGKVNEPAYVSMVGEYLAGLRGMKSEELARITTENFFRLFSKAEQK